MTSTTPKSSQPPLSSTEGEQELSSKFEKLSTNEFNSASTTTSSSSSEPSASTSSTATTSTITANEDALQRVANLIKSGKYNKIVVMCGAGLSTAAGIPDFRSRGTGIYEIIQSKYPQLRDPEDIFSINTFKVRPQIYYEFCRTSGFLMKPLKYKPTLCHLMIKLLESKGLLLRDYTQNVDCLEKKATISEDKLIQVHGSMDSVSCILNRCRTRYPLQYLIDYLKKNTDVPRCTKCRKWLKPDVVFFGESLPERFHNNYKMDMRECDLMIVIGTSLRVYPFANLTTMIAPGTPRVLINRELSGDITTNQDYDKDEFLEGDIEKTAWRLIQLLGWEEDLKELKKTIATSKEASADPQQQPAQPSTTTINTQ